MEEVESSIKNEKATENNRVPDDLIKYTDIKTWNIYRPITAFHIISKLLTTEY